MKQLIKNKFFIVSAFLFILIAGFAIVSIQNSSNHPHSTPPTPLPTILPTFVPGEVYDKEYQDQFPTIAAENQPILERELLVSQFHDSLPYTGTYIKVTYNIGTHNTTVILDRNNTSKANEEFNKLLQKNGIKDRSWIRDLVIISE